MTSALCIYTAIALIFCAVVVAVAWLARDRDDTDYFDNPFGDDEK